LAQSSFEPYKNKFLIKWDGKYVAGLSKMSALKRTTEVIKHRSGGDPSSSRKSPGRTEYEPITLERGVTHDDEFEEDLGAVSGSQDFRKGIIIDILNEAGQPVLSYTVYRCWVSEYQALPDLDANANAIAIEHIKIENEGWARDTSVKAPTKPS
jgi:phage tail-like protein